MGYSTTSCRAVAAFALLLASSSLVAQNLRITPGGVLHPGTTAQVNYRDPQRAGQTIAVTVTGGFPVPVTQEVLITLDDKGNGTGQWAVPAGWRNAKFNAPGCSEQVVPIG
jgi:hypothetical protein